MPETENKKEELLSGGVLIVGSLLWEESEIRDKWRLQCLDLKQRQLVSLPIRYGRISTTRNCTYTMVFSSECKTQENLGTGVFIPFTVNPINFEQLEVHVKRMISAEFNKEKNLSSQNWDWGAMGISFNPNVQSDDSPKSIAIASFLAKWAKKYSNTFNPDDYKVGKETSVISKAGILSIDCQNLHEKIDFVIATVIKPELKNYPTVKNIADRIVVNEYDKYFRENRREGIITFQDLEVDELLSNR